MPMKQLVSVPISTGSFAPISASIYSDYVEIQEDGSGAGAGLQVQFPDDNFTTTYEYPPAAQPIKLGASPVSGSARSFLRGKPQRIIPVPNGNGGYTNITEPATIYCKVKSMAAATVVRVDERP